MYIIAGLGNPGRKYENTRHNLGFITIDRLAEKCGIEIKKSKFKSLIGEGVVSGEKVVFLKPQTFMNNSGEAIREALRFYKVQLSNLLVIYDDIDIPMGDIRIRMGGSAGTHNGMKSIVYHLMDDHFPRIRIGIGKGNKSDDIIDYVLGGFSGDEVKPLEEACDNAVEAIICYIEKGIDASMNRYNKKNHKPKTVLEVAKDKRETTEELKSEEKGES